MCAAIKLDIIDPVRTKSVKEESTGDDVGFITYPNTIYFLVYGWKNVNIFYTNKEFCE